MFKNYLKTAIRNLRRNKQFTLINIVGLALGIAVFLLIMQYVAFEWGANRYNKNYTQLYRLNVVPKAATADISLSPGYAPMVQQQVPAVARIVRVAEGLGGGVVTYSANQSGEKKVFRENNVSFVEGNFLDVFSFPIVAGSPSLAEPKTMAISETFANKVFGTNNAIGQNITLSNQFGNIIYTVKAVFAQPQNSDVKADLLLSIKTLESATNRDGNDWANITNIESNFANYYIQLKPGANAANVNQQITSVFRAANLRMKDNQLALQPFNELHLAPSFNYPFQTFGNLTLVVVFFCVAVLILLIGWVNYINLSTAQALNRAKEVGVKKVLGASRLQLMLQYLTETLLLTLFSAVLAVLLVYFSQPVFNNFTGKKLSLSVLNQPWAWLIGIGFIVLGSLLSGAYVAFVLTAFKPVTAIRGKAAQQVGGFSLRKTLVVFQFTISIVFIIATVVLYRQLQYMQNQNLGINLNQLLVVQGPTVATDGQAARNVAFKNSLAQMPFVKKVSASNNVPGIGYNFGVNGITKFNSQPEDEKKAYSMFICDQNFFDTYGIQFNQGQTFTRDDAERSWNNVPKVIINEKAARSIGFDPKENLIGQKIKWGKIYEIIGVVKDYHHLSLQEEIKPVVYLGSVSFSYFTIKTGEENMQSKLATIKKQFDQNFPGNPFEYFFANEKYDQQYQSQQQLGKLFIASALVAVLIACLGLFGLAAFSARQRTKEIGIRKVLGASVKNITILLSKDFLKLVFFSILIASPIAYFMMQKWLQNFAYKTSISWWIFVLAGTIAITIALLTISFQSVKAALANPVKSLKVE